MKSIFNQFEFSTTDSYFSCLTTTFHSGSNIYSISQDIIGKFVYSNNPRYPRARMNTYIDEIVSAT